MKLFFTKLNVLLLCFICTMTLTANAQTATVTSDQLDYAPQSNAIFTGSGFAPGETVVLKVKNISRACNTIAPDSSYSPWSVTADAVGGFVTNWTVCNCPGDSLRLKAVGQSSGAIAYLYFKDSPDNWTLSVSSSPSTACVGSPADFTIRITGVGNGNSSIGCANVNIPASFGTLGTPSSLSSNISSAALATWSVSRTGSVVQVKTNNNANRLTNGQYVEFTISATPTTATGSPFTWTGGATQNTNCAGQVVPVNPLPTTAVNALPTSSVTSPGNLSQSTAAGVCTAVVSYSVSPSSGTLSYSFSGATTGSGTGSGSGSTFNKGTTTVTVTASSTNGCGTGTDSKTFTVTINDTVNPTITAPANVTVSTDAGLCSASNVALGNATYADNCPGSIVSNNAPSTYAKGTTIVTWTVTDAAGNTATATQTVTVNDTENPTITAPSNVTVSTDAGLCSASNVALGNATYGDNCPGSTVSNNAPSTYAKGTTIVTWTVADAAGNTATATQTVTVNDTENPTITAPSNVTVSTDAGLCSASNVALGNATYADNCPGSTVSNNAPSTYAKGTTIVTWTVTDASGNTATATQTVTVNDTENPTITAPSNVTVSTDAGLCSASNVNLGSATYGDNCPGSTVSNNAPSTYAKGTTTVTWTVTDAAGNTATATQTVTVNDTENPTITAPANVTVSTDAGLCSASNVALGNATYADNCPGSTVSNNAPSTYAKGTTIVTWTVTDAAGNIATATQTVTVNDTENPTITAPANVTVSTDAGLCSASGVNVGNATYGDNCPGSTVSNNAPSTYAKGTTIVTWTVTDAAGNIATATQTVTVNDTENPTITAPANVTVSTDAGLCSASNVNLSSAAYGDNCPGSTLSNNAPLVYPKGVTTVTWTVTDAAGNTATATQTITVNDTENPTITAPANVTVSTDAGLCSASNVALGNATYADNCPGSTVSNNAPSTYAKGTTIVTWTVTDAAGNIATATQTVTVNDTENPTITAPSNVTVSTDAGLCSASNVNLGSATYADNCPSSTVSNNAPSTYAKGTTIVTWTVTDAAGNIATATQTVTVNDTENPTITAPANVTVSTDAGLCSASNVNLGSATYADNCPGSTVSNNAPSTYAKGTTIVTWTVTDAAGNIATATQTVTVNDTENPTITAPSNVTVSTDAGLCSASNVNLGSATYADNCPGSTVSNNAPSTYAKGTTIVTWTVTDAAGNIATATQTVTVNDTENPTITAPANVTVSTDAGLCSASNVNLGSATYADNCPGSTVSNNAPSTYAKGTTIVTWTVTDVAGNIATATQTVTVNDTENPTITAPANVTVSTDAGLCSASNVNLGSATYGDNCPGSTISNNAPLTYAKGTTIVTWTVTDAAGNTATATQTVTVNDTENPTITAPANVTVSTDAGLCSASNVALGNATYGDNCPGSTVSNNAPSVYPKGVTTVTWTVTDAAGNTATATQTITVNDTENPTITAPANVTVSTDAGSCSASNVALGNATYADNCPGSTVSSNAPSVYPKGVTTITWTVTDAAGNTATATQTVTVNDTENPTITAPSNVTVSTDAGSCSASGVNIGNATYGDNCPGSTVSNNAPSVYPKGVTTVTWTVADAAGNTTTATQTVTVNDTENPTITAPANVTVSTDAGSCSASNVALGNATYADNCPGSTASNNAPSTYAKGTTIVTWTVTDASGNTATATQTVTVNDTENPTITAPTNVTVSTDAGLCSASGVNLGNATYGDNCPGSTVSNNSPSVYPKGVTTVTWTVTDASGNIATATQTVTVNDTENPIITAPSNVTVSTDAGLCSASNVSLGNATYGDNCPGSTVSNNAPLTYAKGTTIVIWTVTDASGNTATATQTVTVNDTEAPVITCPANIVLPACVSTATWSAPMASDNCPGVSVVQTAGPASGSSFANGTTTTISYKATDAAGNISTCSFTVTRAAVLTASSSFTPILCNGAMSTVTVTAAGGTAPYTGTGTFTTGAGNYSYTVTDANGCTVTTTGNIPQPSAIVVVSTTPNRQLYFGFAADQTSTITTAPTGGTAPYTITYTLLNGNDASVSRPLNCNVSSADGDETWTAAGGTTTGNICPASGAGSNPVSTLTNVPAGGSYSITVKLLANAIIKATVTDANGCIVSDTTKIWAEDVRCFNGNSGKAKVKICHRNGSGCGEICVDENAVAAHLAHGDFLGACTPGCVAPPTYIAQPETQPEAEEKSAPFRVIVAPNPSVSNFKLTIESESKEPISIKVFDLLGRAMGNMSKVNRNTTVTIGDSFKGGTYYAEVVQGNNRQVVKLIKLN